jgi:hypothetical protein
MLTPESDQPVGNESRFNELTKAGDRKACVQILGGFFEPIRFSLIDNSATQARSDAKA